MTLPTLPTLDGTREAAVARLDAWEARYQRDARADSLTAALEETTELLELTCQAARNHDDPDWYITEADKTFTKIREHLNDAENAQGELDLLGERGAA